MSYLCFVFSPPRGGRGCLEVTDESGLLSAEGSETLRQSPAWELDLKVGGGKLSSGLSEPSLLTFLPPSASQACGGSIQTSVNALSADVLGHCQDFEETQIGGER